MKQRTVLFGASNLGLAAYDYLRGDYEIIGYCDNDPKKWGTRFNGLPIYPPSHLFEDRTLHVIITSNYYKEIAKQLTENQVTKYDVFDLHEIKFKEALAEKQKNNEKIRIVIGASQIFEQDWLPTEMSFLDITSSEQWRKYFAEGSIDAVMAEHVWEHMTKEEGQVAAQNCYNFLKPGGYLRVAVPDGYHPNKEYIQAVDVGKDEHQCLYTYDEFCKIFLRSGFAVKLLEYWDENGEFHYRDWDCQDGMIHRSRRFDRRNVDGRLGYTSIIVDAIKIE